ncbi:MAG: radical SAM protein [Acidobacteria bacterium]|nr:MAG: radical SAM protein [Acidobacteriota bacterium]
MLQLQIETTTYCNSRCVFCPHHKMKRTRESMDMDLFKKIIDEAAALPLISQICLTGLGETLMDKQLLERVDYVRRRMPTIHLDMFTNGHLFTAELYRELAKRRLTKLYVSLNAVRPEQRKAIMGLSDYDQVVSELRKAIALKLLATPIVVKAVVNPDLLGGDDITEFERNWNGMYCEGGNAFLHTEGNWAGDTWRMRTPPTHICTRVMMAIMVLVDGRVAQCCFDTDGRYILGDLRTETIKDVFNSEKATALRLAMSEGRRDEIELCKGCTGI